MSKVDIHRLVIVIKYDIKLDGLSMIHKDIGQALSFERYHVRLQAEHGIFQTHREVSLCIVQNPSTFIISMFWE